MSLFKPDGRLERLRAGYRAAFREWVSARNVLGGVGRNADAEAEAQAQEVAAALAYRDARDHLADAMAHGRVQDVARDKK